MYVPLGNVPDGRRFEILVNDELTVLTKVTNGKTDPDTKLTFTLAIGQDEKYHHIRSDTVVLMVEE